jgi:hypothetical protein
MFCIMVMLGELEIKVKLEFHKDLIREVEMKRFYIFSFLIALFAVFIWLNSDSLAKVSNNNQDSLSSVIDEFWQNALKDNVSEIKKITTETPKDFFDMENKCLQEKVKISNDDGLIQVRKSVSSQLNQDNIEFILKISDTIKEGGYVYHKIIEKEINGNHALLRVIYGKNEFDRYGDLFLLHKENGKDWKIFMITTDLELNLINKHYFKSSCSNE